MKRISRILLAAITILLLVSCQGSPGVVEVTRVVEREGEQVVVTRVVEVEGEPQTVVVTPTAAPKDESGPRTLTIFTTEADPPQLEALSGIIDEYHEMNPEVFIDIVTGTPGTRGERISTLVAAGADAGIFEIEPSFQRDWAEAGYLLPLTDVFEELGGEEEYVPGSYYSLNGTVYSLPYATSVYGLWYRTDLFEQAGLEPPTNYDELVHAAETLTDPSNGIYGLSFAGTSNTSVSFFSTFLWHQCLDYYTPTGELIFDQPEALEAVERWVALTEYAPPGFENWSWGDQVTAFVTGQTAMSMYAGRLGVRMADQTPHLESISNIVRLPWSYTEGADYVTYGAWSRFAISANTAYPETAKDFLKFFLSGDRLARYDATVLGHMVPPTKSVAALLENWESEYAQNHADWLAFFNRDAEFTNHQSNNMGSMEGCNFVRKDYPPPWGGPIFSTGGVIDVMFQEIYVGGKEPEAAWQEAVTKMKEIQDQWLAEHPDWEPPQY